ncbi:MAG: EamA family transporter [Sphingobacteriales bacterium]|nr:EamA family transporter [Sphingobacteriales bacterium]
MLILLIGSIVLTSYLTLSFKVCHRFGISTFQAIIFNYITCVITGSIVNGSFPVVPGNFQQDWFKWAMLMGTMFISIFNLVAFTTHKAGVAVTSVANKLSMVIPVAFSVWLYNESMGWIKIAGILIALVAVILISIREKDDEKHSINWLIPVLVGGLFISSGLLDTAIKYVEYHFLNEENKNDYLVSAFFFAAVIGTVLLSAQLLTDKQKLQPKAILAGICIGVPNYFSIWCLVKVLKNPPYGLQSSAIIPVNNMGIVLFSAMVALLLFHEKLSKKNWIGIVLSVLSIALIASGDKL